MRGASSEGAEEFWGAARDRDVDVSGEAFEEVGRRVGWAVECVVEEVVGVGGRRRKRPSIGS